jgi:hypothetical protein
MQLCRVIEHQDKGAPLKMKRRWQVHIEVVVAGLLCFAFAVPASANVSPTARGFATIQQVEQLVTQAPSIKSVPSGLTPKIQDAANDANYEPACMPDYPKVTDGPCIFGAPGASKTMVLVGDSHAGMWFGAVNAIATTAHWRLVFLEKAGCPIPDMAFWNSDTNVPYPQCTAWHSYVIARIKKLHPNLLIATSADYSPRDGNDKPVSSQEWTAAMARTIRLASSPNTKAVIIGDIPYPSQDESNCLALHMQAVAACSTPRTAAVLSGPESSNEAAATAVHALYVNVVPWICSTVCTPIVGHNLVYENQYHITRTYSDFLTGALSSQLSPLLKAA